MTQEKGMLSRKSTVHYLYPFDRETRNISQSSDSGTDSYPTDLHQLDRMHRTDADTGTASHTVIGMHFIMTGHVQQDNSSHVAEFCTGATVLAQIVIDHGAVCGKWILPVRLLKLLMRVLKMEQHPRKGITRII
jgi:hypothetical protein